MNGSLIKAQVAYVVSVEIEDQGDIEKNRARILAIADILLNQGKEQAIITECDVEELIDS